MYLSKTDFKEYLQCSKCLWLKKNNPDLYVRPRVSGFNQKLIDEGYEVEFVAREMFGEGVLVAGNNEEAAVKTRELIKSKVSPIFQATFICSPGFLARIDVLVYNEFTNAWNIYEIKSSTKVKTDRNENHIFDVTFQKLVISQVGIPVEQAYIIHLNKDFKKTVILNYLNFLELRMSQNP